MAASSQVLDNFAKKPTSTKVAVFALIGALLGVAYWQVLLSPAQEERDNENTSHARLLKEQTTLDDNLKALKELVKQNDDLQAIITTNQRALPTGSELPALFDHLQRKAGEAGVTIKNWERKPETPVETYMKVTVAIQMTGTFYQIKKYFSLLAPTKRAAPAPVPAAPPPAAPHLAPHPAPAIPEVPRSSNIEERIVSIENLSLDSPELKNEELYLTAKFVAATYRQAEEAAPAKPAPVPAGGKVGNATKAAEDKVKSKTGDTTPDEKAPAEAPADKTKAGADRLKGVE